MTTGTCTGVGGGSSLFTAATCNGSADDAAAFNSFNSWAVSTWQASHAGLIELDVPHGAVCIFNGIGNCSSGNYCFSFGIKLFRMVGLGYSGNGDGATLSVTSARNLSLGGFSFHQDNTHSARTQSINVGDTCVTLVSSGQSALFNVGDYTALTGVDMQQSHNQGFPPNPYFYEYPQVASVNASQNCSGSAGASVTFTAPLVNKYLSTWPLFSLGSAFQVDQGGPATLYDLDQTWNTSQLYIGLTIDNPGNQTGSGGRDINFQNVKFTGGNCTVPSVDESYTITNGDLTNCDMEVDKVNGTVTLTNVTLNQINFQSSSVNQFNLINSTVTSSVQGTPKNFSCSGSTIASLSVGAHAFGRSSSTDLGNCAIASIGDSSVEDFGNGDGNGGTSNPGFNFTREMSSGTIKIANAVTVTNAVDQGGGVLRLTVACDTATYPTCSDATTAFTVGKYYELGNLGLSSGNTQGNYSVAAKNSGAQTIDINLNVSGATFVSQGYFRGEIALWYVPGTNMSWWGQFQYEATFWQVTTLTQDGNWFYIGTTLAGGFPTIPTTTCASGACIAAKVHPSPVFKCSGCSGDVNLVAMAADPAHGPFGSYYKRTYVDGSSTPNLPTFGNISSIDFNVTHAQGSANTFGFSTQVTNSSGTTSSYSPSVNANSVGDRNVTLSGNSCVSGTCTGDSGLTPPDSTLTFLPSGNAPAQYSGSTTGTPVSTTMTMQLNQGVVYPPAFP